MAYDMSTKVAGDEISSTYEGRHITLLESQFTHPYHSDGFVNKGDPILAGATIVGVAFKDAAAATDLIAIDTEGIWALSCVAANYSGNSAIAVGDQLYIGGTPGFNPASGVGIISKDATGVKFGAWGANLNNTPAIIKLNASIVSSFCISYILSINYFSVKTKFKIQFPCVPLPLF